ncbi:HlyD family secretion protein [Sphingosinicellaceae bacterium]|nr:HlyD family secretion protein [Sphingosinicellaceae bacterium]
MTSTDENRQDRDRPEPDGRDAEAAPVQPDEPHPDDDAKKPVGNDDAGKSEPAKGGDGDDEEPKEPEKLPLYKRPLFWIIGGIVLVVLIVGGTLYWLHARQYTSTDDAFVDAHIVRLSAEVSGRLTGVAELDNRHVVAGQILATIEPTSANATLEQARGQLVTAQANVRAAVAQVAAARATRAQAVATARGPAAQAEQARRDLERYLALQQLDPAAVAGTQLDAARANARNTEAQAAAARRDIASQTANIEVAKKQADASRAQIIAARAQIASASNTVGNLHIVAPISGQVVNRSVNLGSYVAPGQQVMAIVPDRLWITANFKETQLVDMRRGQHVDIKVDAFPDVDFEGHVDSIQRGAGQAFALLPPQNATGNYVKVVQRVPVRILFDRPDPRRYAIGPGMSVIPTVKVR